MRRKIRPEDLSEADLRRLLVAKRREARRQRLDAFRQSGRLVDLAPAPGTPLTEGLSAIQIDEPLAPRSEEDLARERRKRLWDRVLLAVEVLAVAGLMFVFFNGANLLQRLNAEVAAALAQPTISPTPLLTAIVLPSGHTPPTDPGGARPNEAEIPEHLRPLVQSLANIPIPTPGPEHAIRIQIPAIGIDAPIVQGDGWEQLKQGVGQHIGSGNPGQPGNLVLSAHNDVFGEIFRHLDQLQTGDEIIVYTNARAYTYIIDVETLVVEPTRTEVLDPTVDSTITLISCYPYLVNDKRIVVRASLSDS
ncbi:MAG: class D sortase [Anaerolineae bacterium]|nr:MAG: class D sortase [Anaerolineae bacterium]